MEEWKVMYESGGGCAQADYILARRCDLKEIGH